MEVRLGLLRGRVYGLTAARDPPFVSFISLGHRRFSAEVCHLINFGTVSRSHEQVENVAT